MTPRSHSLALVACLLLAGCAGPFATPTPTTTPPPDIEVTLANEGNATYTLAYWTIEGPVDSVTEVTTLGETRVVDNLTGTAGARLFRPDDVTEVRWPAAADQEGRFTLPPGSSVSGPVEDPAPGTTVLFLVRTEDRVQAWGTADCGPDDALTLVDVRWSEAGAGLGIGCEGLGDGGTPDERTGR
ncbi:hypothetical protein N0B31_07400 [Salinirubellus salinus]|uniref:Lipoprotein n=1 Tax=Salinirubellus salinus TaxID=1364945 RepID=A0A9E7R6I1_9EURY|nr:hypothetical protein [Salinirubellus salinus]UWM56109.1 hypothetical protein N0B31_07400 [Salinirubellus salinus]